MHIQNTRPLPFPRRSPRHQATRPHPWHHIRDGFIVAAFLPLALIIFALRVEGLL